MFGILSKMCTLIKKSGPQTIRQLSTVNFDIQQNRPQTPRPIGFSRARYGGRNAVTMLPGGGIGPELMSYVKRVFFETGMPVDFETVRIDPKSDNNDDLDYAIMSIRRNGVCIKGNIETESQSQAIISRNVAIRNELDLFVNAVHVQSYNNVPSHHKNVNIIVVRQNTEGEYAMLEHESVPGVVESLKVITRDNSTRLARYAFELAKKNGRSKVTAIHKANIMKLSDGLFLETCINMSSNYPDIDFDHMIIDNCCMQLVSDPHQFDVMVMPNLYGSIVSNVICGLVGGAGMMSGKNYGDHYAVFEPGTRNTGSSIAGTNTANPVAMLNASADMLEHLGHQVHCNNLRTAICKTLNEDMLHTADLNGTAKSSDVVQNIIKHIKTITGTI
ncbi:PREDICTED: isocitrate dehydrogenase [NAD] subunit gamma, mitochondrial-like [Diuraphis noxia]|uniref:isocitrate dehydrogenase [NAD] subunit gamma, mitochondrial-like n=1 Tax=Diuraphis noxia TaxID=143948 RepID=UPI0007636E79|nr:PREDICTED: isocitrate dehydrogenase [NAD] subunit gamma, mitochondrial-like [Diuraphis noxia]